MAFCQNFWIWNPRKSIKGSKDLDFSLVFNKNILSEIFWSSSLGPRPHEVRQSGLNLLRLWHHLQKIETQNKFFSVQTWLVFWGFEQLSSSIN